MVRQSVLKALLSLSWVAALVACASSSQIRGNTGAPPELSQHVSAGTVVLWVPSGGTFQDAGQIARVSVASNENVRTLVTQLRPAATTPVQLAVAGDNSSLTKAVTLAALGDVDGPLPMLEFTFLGSSVDADTVRVAIEGKKGRFAFEAWP